MCLIRPLTRPIADYARFHRAHSITERARRKHMRSNSGILTERI